MCRVVTSRSHSYKHALGEPYIWRCCSVECWYAHADATLRYYYKQSENWFSIAPLHYIAFWAALACVNAGASELLLCPVTTAKRYFVFPSGQCYLSEAGVIRLANAVFVADANVICMQTTAIRICHRSCDTCCAITDRLCSDIMASTAAVLARYNYLFVNIEKYYIYVEISQSNAQYNNSHIQPGCAQYIPCRYQSMTVAVASTIK